MDKLLVFPGKSDRGIFTYVIDAERGYLEKTAAAYHPTIAAYINSAKPIKGKTQILLTALGANEWWGVCNVNGDGFPESALAHEGADYGFKTFEHHAKIYKHHVNKDPSAAFGDVALAVYNQLFHRVELIVVLDNEKAPDIADMMEHGEYPDWSMGCKVPYDICSICGNRAPTRKQYCDHLRYYMGKIPPGQQKIAYAINTMPKFFDISRVLIGADRTAKTHRKVAGAAHPLVNVSSALLAEKQAELKDAAAKKIADMDKRVSTGAPPASMTTLHDLLESIPEVKAHEAPLPTETLNQLGKAPLPEVASTLAMLGILPKPQEFQRIVLVSLGQRAAADELDRRGMCFDPMDGVDTPEAESRLGLCASRFSPSLMELLTPFMSERSYSAPHLGRRLVIMVKRGYESPLPTFIKVSNHSDSTERKPIGILPMLALAAGMYAVFARKASPEAVKGMDKLIASHPGLAAALGLGLYATFSGVLKPGIKGNAVPGETYSNPDTTDVFRRIEEQKSKPYAKVASVGAAAKRLIIGIPAAYMASGVLQKHKQLSPHDGESRMKSFIRKNPDVISGALIADAMLSLQGRGTHGISRAAKSYFSKAAEAATDLVGDDVLSKTASAQEFLTGALVPALAFGKANLPGRIVGGLFDQAVLEVSKHYLDKKHAE